MKTFLLLLAANASAQELICLHDRLTTTGFDPSASVQIFASNDLKRWEPRYELAAKDSVPLSPTNRVEFYKARTKPKPATITFTCSQIVTGQTFTLTGSADKVLTDLRCNDVKGHLTQQHFGVSNRLSVLLRVDFTFPPLTLVPGTNLLRCYFRDIDNNVVQTNFNVLSVPGATVTATNQASYFLSITAHSFAWSYTYWDREGSPHSKDSSGAMLQPDGAVNQTMSKDHYGSSDVCSQRYSGYFPYLYLDDEEGPCLPPTWRIYPVSMEFGSYNDRFPGDTLSHSANSAITLFLRGSGTKRLHCSVQVSLCRWWRDGSYGDEWNECVEESAPLYIGGMPADSAGRISFDTVDGTQWDLTPTIAPMNSGYYAYEVDYTVSEIVPAS